MLNLVLRHIWVIAGVAGLFGVAALIFSQSTAPTYEAVAELIVEDPRSGSLLSVTTPGDRANIASERYLADQVEIIESTRVARLASDMLDSKVSATSIIDRRTVTGSPTSNLIEVAATASDPVVAAEISNALAAAYVEVRVLQTQETAEVALRRVEALLAASDVDLAQIRGDIAELLEDDDERQERLAQVEKAMVDLNELRLSRDAAPVGSDLRADLNGQIDELARDFAAWESAIRLEEQNRDLSVLLSQQEAAVAEQANLKALRNAITVEAEVVAGGVSLVFDAEPPTEPLGPSRGVLILLAVTLGLLVGAAVARYLEVVRDSDDSDE